MSRLRHPIRAIREPFGKAGLTVAVIALVFAMVGGAFAAAGLNGKQKKEVKAIAKSFQGTGPAGANGSNGANGKDGANGANGAPGTGATTETFTGAAHGCTEGGVVVKSASPEAVVCNGKKGTNGTNGKDGETGFTETLPPGKTETGTWSVDESGPKNDSTIVPISFSIPLPSGVESVYVDGEETEEGAEPGGCKWQQGNAEATPEAPPGKLCVFAQIESKAYWEFRNFITPGTNLLEGLAGPAGVYMYFESSNIPPENTAELFALGAWAVTASTAP
jgi:hypothetical protein